MFVVKGEITTDGSNNIKLSYSSDRGLTYYTDEFTETGLYLAVFEDNYAVDSRRLDQSETNIDASGLIDTLNEVVVDRQSFSFPSCLKGAPTSDPSSQPSSVPSSSPGIS